MWICMPWNEDGKIWVVGFYSPDGRWHKTREYESQQSAECMVNYLNGGTGAPIH
jgi:hypothetical protein